MIGYPENRFNISITNNPLKSQKKIEKTTLYQSKIGYKVFKNMDVTSPLKPKEIGR